jgi:hypothetical protein
MAVLERFCRLVAEGAATGDAARAALADEAGPASAGRSSGDRTPAAGHAAAGSARGLTRCAVRLDSARMLALLEDAVEQAGVVAAWEETIEPALLAIGRKWTETHGRYVEAEHLLSWCVTAALHRVRPAAGTAPASGTPSRPILLACAPGEWHSLPMEVLRAELACRGEPVCMLGAAVPAEALRDAVARLGPARVVVWSQSPGTADPAALPRGAGRGRTRVLPAGPGWAGARPAVPGVLLRLADALEACRG